MMQQQQKRPWRWFLWHPHQRLWNRDLLGLIKKIAPSERLYNLAWKAIIFFDTIVLSMQVLVRRCSKVGLMELFTRPKLSENMPLLYFDLGTHKAAKELRLVVNTILPKLGENYQAYGFEASREFIEVAQSKCTGNHRVMFIQKALCHSLPDSGKIKLYKEPGEGKGSSLYRSSFAEFEEVDAIRFSDWLRDNRIDVEKSVCLLRMNIEGAEYDIITDLLESGVAKHIDGYYGMWDDVSKIDLQRDREFRALLKTHKIYPIPFNSRDFFYSFRVKCIEYDFYTNVLAGMQRKSKRR